MNLSNKQKTSLVLVDKRGFFRGTPDGIRTHDLQSRSFDFGVFHRCVMWRKALKNQGFLNLPFFIVLQNNSTFRNGVELKLNYFRAIY